MCHCHISQMDTTLLALSLSKLLSGWPIWLNGAKRFVYVFTGGQLIINHEKCLGVDGSKANTL